MPREFSYRLTLAQMGIATDPDYLRAPAEARRKVLDWMVRLGLKEKDADLAAGLDSKGKPLAPIKLATRRHRDSEMGPADPNAPPLTPAYAASRTRLLLTGEVDGESAVFWWEYDAKTGDTWGRILDYHRRGVAGRSRTRRDVIGLSPEAVRRVRDELRARWMNFKLAGYRTTARQPAPAVPPPRIVATGRTDFERFTYGIGGGSAADSQRALDRGMSTGWRQRRPGQGLPAIGGPGTLR